jgi:3-phosphoshikimate 1-carboxyvinyltransferase
MNYTISHPNKIIQAEINLPPSKSISNRALIIQALCQANINLFNLSQSSDTTSLIKALGNTSKTIDIGDAGTSMRFLTAYLSQRKGHFILTGSERMKERPIRELVHSLNSLGADIKYLEKEGYPPLKIKGKTLIGGEVSLSANISSQYISALLLIAPTLEKGLIITIENEILSRPYIQMTLEMMSYFGINSSWKNNKIIVKPQAYKPKSLIVEADWSALAFILEVIALSDSAKVIVNGLSDDSWQGDNYALELFKKLGLNSEFINKKLHLVKKEIKRENNFDANLLDTPDLAQAYCSTLSGLSLSAEITGLNNLKLKESHRLKALQSELNKIGQDSKYNEDSLKLYASELHPPTAIFESHKDHRMAMCIAPLAVLFDVTIKDIEVVNKSYPHFWEDMKKMGFTISPQAHSNN